MGTKATHVRARSLSQAHLRFKLRTHLAVAKREDIADAGENEGMRGAASHLLPAPSQTEVERDRGRVTLMHAHVK